MKALKRIAYAACLSIAFVLSGCSDNELQNDESVISHEDVKTFSSFNVSVEDSPVTRAHLENGTQMVWDEEDVIGVYSDKEGVVPFTYAGNNTFTSKKPVSGTKFYAYYPYNENNVADANNKGTVFFTLPELFTDDRIANAMPMVAVSNDNNLHFKQTVGLMHFTLGGEQHILGVKYESKGHESVAGSMIVKMLDDEPIMSPTEGNVTTLVKIECDITLGADETKDFYFPVPAGSYTEGFVLSIETPEGTFFKSKNAPMDITRAKIHSFPAFKTDRYSIERESLVALYNSTNGESWTNKEGWLTDKPLGEWYGVKTDGDGFVSEINLNLNNLSGVLPVEIGNFNRLEYLYIQGNPELTGNIPSSIGNLYNVKRLEFASNDLTGNIPSSICNLSKLLILNLSGNKQLTGPIPDNLAGLRMINRFYIEGCNLTGSIPESIGDIGSGYDPSNHWIMIGLSRNSLTGPIPASLAKLKNFDSLNLSYNQLTGSIPDEFLSISSLADFWINNNNMDGVISKELQACSWWNGSIDITQNEGHKLTLEEKEDVNIGNIEELGNGGTQDW